MSETPLVDEETNNLPHNSVDPFADNLAMQESLHESAAIARRQMGLNDNETVQPQPMPAGDAEKNPRLRITPRGQVVAVAVLTGAAAAIAAPFVVTAMESAPKAPVKTMEVTVDNGQGLEAVIESHVPQVAAGKLSWQDVAADISQLPQNSEIAKPGHVLQPGETIAIPIYSSEK